MGNTYNHTLLPLDLFTRDAPIDIDVVYANPLHDDNQFPGLYHPQARMFIHIRLAPVILIAARLLHQRTGWRMKINDCFRSVEAQAKMAAYGFPAALVAPPGVGGHPRGMAIDVEPVNYEGDLIPMGTPFDFFTDDLSQNPAARHWQDFGPPAMSAQIVANRKALDDAMFDAAKLCGEELVGYAEEWWDYRFTPEVYQQYPAYAEADLPPALHLTQAPQEPDQNLMAKWAQERDLILNKIHDLAVFT